MPQQFWCLRSLIKVLDAAIRTLAANEASQEAQLEKKAARLGCCPDSCSEPSHITQRYGGCSHRSSEATPLTGGIGRPTDVTKETGLTPILEARGLVKRYGKTQTLAWAAAIFVVFGLLAVVRFARR